MILPPSLLVIRAFSHGKKKCSLWIPLFLVWPIVIALMVVLSPVALIVYIVWSGGRHYIAAGPRLLALVWAVRGLRVRVDDGEDRVRVQIL